MSSTATWWSLLLRIPFMRFLRPRPCNSGFSHINANCRSNRRYLPSWRRDAAGQRRLTPAPGSCRWAVFWWKRTLHKFWLLKKFSSQLRTRRPSGSSQNPRMKRQKADFLKPFTNCSGLTNQLTAICARWVSGLMWARPAPAAIRLKLSWDAAPWAWSIKPMTRSLEERWR